MFISGCYCLHLQQSPWNQCKKIIVKISIILSFNCTVAFLLFKSLFIFCLVFMYNMRPISFFACEYQVFPRMFVGNTDFSWFHGSFVKVSQAYTWPFVSGLYGLSPSIHTTVLMAGPVQLHNTFWNQISMLPALSFHSRLTCCLQSMWVLTFLERKGWKWAGKRAT